MNGFDKDQVKDAARGQWRAILSAVAGISSDALDGKHHACPKCNGKDRFRLLDEQAGAVICNGCFAKNNGDGIAAVQWATGCTFPQAVRLVAEHCGLAPVSNGKSSSDPLERTAREKRVPVDSWRVYGATAEHGAVVLPMFDADGKQCSTFTIRPGGDKGKCARGKPAGVFLPIASGDVLKGDAVAQVPQAGEAWLLLEGGKDPAALHALGYKAMGMSTCRLNGKFIPLLRGVNVTFVPDRDKAGDEGAQQSAGKIFRSAASVKVAALPAEMKPADGADTRDVLAMPDGERLVRDAIENAQLWQPESPPAGGLRPQIKVGPDEHRMTAEAVAILATRGDLFQRGGMLVEIRENPAPPPGIFRPEGGVRAVRIPRPRLRGLLSESAEFVRLKKTDDGDEWVPTHIPQPVVDQVEVRGTWPKMPLLEGVVTSPQFLADGSILTTPGYHAHSGLFFAADCRFPSIAERPSIADAKAACESLLEVVSDFPIDEVSRASWLSIALTVAARHAIDGPSPLFSLDSNVRGSGKSKAADSVGVIHSGRELPRSTITNDDAETRKMITATLLAGEPIVLLDNVGGALGCPALDALLTSSTWTDRILGASQMTAAIPARAVWLASGNNMTFQADTARRTLRIRLQSPLENPEERTGFRHPDLLGWVKRERGRLAADTITILRAWHCAGRPDMKLPPWGSFESWSSIIRNTVVWLGMPDPGITRQEVQRESDREAMLLRQLLDAWEAADPVRHGITAARAIDLAEHGDVALQNVIGEMAVAGKITARGIGNKLRHLRGRVCGGRYFDSRDSNQGAIWIVRRSEEMAATLFSDSEDSSDSKSNPSRVSFHIDDNSNNVPAGAGATVTRTPRVTCEHAPQEFIRRGNEMHCPFCEIFVGFADEYPTDLVAAATPPLPRSIVAPNRD